MHEIPTSIYCPKCGIPIKLERILDVEMINELKQRGFDHGARGLCSCGVTVVLGKKELPKSPTYTLMFNIYRFQQ